VDVVQIKEGPKKRTKSTGGRSAELPNRPTGSLVDKRDGERETTEAEPARFGKSQKSASDVTPGRSRSRIKTTQGDKTRRIHKETRRARIGDQAPEGQSRKGRKRQAGPLLASLRRQPVVFGKEPAHSPGIFKDEGLMILESLGEGDGLSQKTIPRKELLSLAREHADEKTKATSTATAIHLIKGNTKRRLWGVPSGLFRRFV